MYASYIEQEDEQPIEAIKEEEEEDSKVSWRDIEQSRNQSIVIEEEQSVVVDYSWCLTDEVRQG